MYKPVVCGYWYSSCSVCCAAPKKSRLSRFRRLLLSCFRRSKSNKSSSSRAIEEFYAKVDSLPACDCCSLRGPDYEPEGKLNFPVFFVQNRLKVLLALSHFFVSATKFNWCRKPCCSNLCLERFSQDVVLWINSSLLDRAKRYSYCEPNLPTFEELCQTTNFLIKLFPISTMFCTLCCYC